MDDDMKVAMNRAEKLGAGKKSKGGMAMGMKEKMQMAMESMRGAMEEMENAMNGSGMSKDME